MSRCVCFILMAVLVFANYDTHAQLCQGSLGDPIVNITFGSGPNPGTSLSAATTNYQYFSNDCPGDGFYTVRNSTGGCFGNTWQVLNSDHTGGGNGYFMLVNASIAPSAFYLDTVKGLCGNTTYEFAAWIINVLLPSACNGAGIKPNLTFTIEGTNGMPLGKYNSGDIPSQTSPVWQQFGFFFTTPANVSDIVLKIFNNAPGGCGNDLALDDITFRPCGPKLTPTITGTASSTASLCQGVSKSYSFSCTVSPGFNSPVFQWQQNFNNGPWTDIAGETTTTLNKTFNGSEAFGVYNYRLSASEIGNAVSAQCRVVSQPLTVQVNANPVTTAANDGPGCSGKNVQLSASGGTAYSWTGVNNFSASGSPATINTIPQNGAGKYFVLVTNSNGCTHIDSTIVAVNPSPVAVLDFSNAPVCSGDSKQLGSSGGGTYLWIPAATLSSAVIANPIATPLVNTTYLLTVTNSFLCTDTASIFLSVQEKPTADAGPSKIIIKGESVQLQATATGQQLNYFWSPALYINNPQILQPVVSPPDSTRYTLLVTSANGCGTATDFTDVFVYKGIYIPAAFSPNGDGLNDTWKIPALYAFTAFDLSVYDRYGQLVFQNKNVVRPWDGTYKGEPVAAGAYVYIIRLNKAPFEIKGNVLVVR